MKKKGSRKKGSVSGDSFRMGKKENRKKSYKSEGLWRELKQIFGTPAAGVHFECEKPEAETDPMQTCQFRDTCSASRSCAGPDYCGIFIRFEEGSLP
ncbi:MAG: hypothetical protein ABIJ82_01880 [Patescibacteria group bacterium]|nr:hypothetical protein [Patescibacteria group bacterium]MBU1953298.1 hypothetical protein [Patescibacteria group bacterium]